jgi:hypothetical protein
MSSAGRDAAVHMADAGGMASTPPPLLVTTAGKSAREERRQRERRYLLTMGLRVVCFIAAIVLFAAGLRFAGAIAAAGSLILPWVAVVVANAGPRRAPGQPTLYAREHRELPPTSDGTRETPGPARPPRPRR